MNCFLEAPKGEKRKRNTDEHPENGVELESEGDDGPPRKI